MRISYLSVERVRFSSVILETATRYLVWILAMQNGKLRASTSKRGSYCDPSISTRLGCCQIGMDFGYDRGTLADRPADPFH